MGVWRRRVLIVDDDTIVRALVTTSLVGAGFEVEACADTEAARTLIAEFDPDLVVLEANLQGSAAGVQFGATLAQVRPELAVLYLTRYPTLLSADTSIAGLRGRYPVLAKDDVVDAGVLVQAVECALQGDATSAVAAPRVDGAVLDLNATQLDILNLVAQGFTNAAIAEQRGTQERTIERQLKAAYDTLGLATSGSQNARVGACQMNCVRGVA